MDLRKRRGRASVLLTFTAAAGCAGVTSSGSSSEPGSARPSVATASGPEVPLLRLTREQYRNTVRDLLGINDVPLDLPVDEASGGFSSNSIAPVTELHLEKYGAAAAELSRRAVTRAEALLRCGPGTRDEAACARDFITSFGRRAYRRPLDAEEAGEYESLFTTTRARSDLGNALRVVVATMLQSVHFLYRFEPAPPPTGDPRPVRLSPHALASRLSYFLWSTMPDEILLSAADSGRLATDEEIAAQASRLMADPRFSDSLTSFHFQWLDLLELEGTEKRKKIFPAWSEEMRAAVREETSRFVTQVMREGDGKLETLLTARHSWVGGPLYELYGLDAPKGAEAGFRRVALNPAERAGVLTQASVMSVHAHWDKSSLVHRGKLIREKLFCTQLPPPPPDVNNTLPAADPKVSARERFEDHRADVGCARCHRLIDPLGAPFEIYDGIGRYRTMDGPAAVDAEGEVRGTAHSDGAVKNAVELADRLATSDEVRACVARQWLRFALGRELFPADEPALASALASFRAADHKVPALIQAITATDSFRGQTAAP